MYDRERDSVTEKRFHIEEKSKKRFCYLEKYQFSENNTNFSKSTNFQKNTNFQKKYQFSEEVLVFQKLPKHKKQTFRTASFRLAVKKCNGMYLFGNFSFQFGVNLSMNEAFVRTFVYGF